MEMFQRVRGPVALATYLIIFGSAAIAAETKPAINLDIAKKMVAACEAKAKQEGWKMNIAIVDDGANQSRSSAWTGRIWEVSWSLSTRL